MNELTQCGDDPRTTGHIELITKADELATAVLNGLPFGGISKHIRDLAEQYRSLRIQATSEAGQRR